MRQLSITTKNFLIIMSKIINILVKKAILSSNSMLTAGICLLAGILCSAVTLAGPPEKEIQPMIGDSAPLFSLQALNGRNYSLADALGKYVVIHFATSWCPFCAAEAPHLQKVFEDYREKGVMVYLVDVKEDPAIVKQYAEKFDLSLPVLLDLDGAVATQYAPPETLPDLKRDEVPLASNLVIDREGKIRFYSLLNTRAFDAKLTQLQEVLGELLSEESR